jgi:Raf kinase inhibitor-like YbhB/YbcL family protein
MSNFTLTSPEFKDQAPLQLVHEFDGYDGTGQNRSPTLQWQGVPEGTKSFALTLYDPDAPTGSGFWHWILFDIDSSVTQLTAGLGSADGTDLGASGTQAANDYGAIGYGGPCPPKGMPVHHYIFTVHALGVPKLGLPANATNAVVRFFIYQNTLATATLTGLYKR